MQLLMREIRKSIEGKKQTKMMLKFLKYLNNRRSKIKLCSIRILLLIKTHLKLQVVQLKEDESLLNDDLTLYIFKI